MIGIALGLLYANAGEWLIHKYVLHGRGRNKRDFFSFHWHEHHQNARRLDNYDPAYEQALWSGWHSPAKEAASLAGLAAAHLPLLPVAPFFVAGVVGSTFYYHYVHKRSHQDVAWARRRLPWHVDHHLGPDQHANWCVSWPWFDWIMRTRKPYIGTEAEARDIARRGARGEGARA